MKKYFIFATALAALASCSSDDFVGESPNGVNGQIDGAISFNMGTTAVTRADKTGAAAAGDLGNQFIVYGEKNETQVNGEKPASGAVPSTGNYVFPNYQVNYVASTAYTTTSNTKNWEYVGYTHSTAYQNNILTCANPTEETPTTVSASGAAQTIKYWDYGADNYVFTAVSAKQEDITSGRVTIQKNTTGTTVYDKGYTITLEKTDVAGDNPDIYPALNKLYFSKREVIDQGTGSDRTAVNAYGGNVTLTFQSLVSQIRAGVYETIHGYDITEIKFYVTSNIEAKVGDNSAFGAICPNAKTDNFEGQVKVVYYQDGAVKNQPKVTYNWKSGLTDATDLILGTNMKDLSTTNLLGKTASSPSWDKSGGVFTEVLPQIENSTNLKLKVNYKLWNNVTNEIITVEGATAEVPAQYLQWKPNYKYTYLFKISDNTNGSTGTPGTDPAGLYPITFDAVEVIAEDGKAEYITTVSEPSITTFGVSGGKYTTGGNEYPIGSDIYATFTEGSNVKTPTLGTSGAQHVNVYKVTASDATLITEASVAEAIANPASITAEIYTFDGTSTYTKVTDPATLTSGTAYYKSDGEHTPETTGYTQTLAVAGTDYQVAPNITVTNINEDASENFSEKPSIVSSVPAEDGTTKNINALKLTGVKAGTYAIEYEASTEWTGTYKKVYKIIVVQ